MLRRPEYVNVKWSRNSHRICRQSALSSVKWCRSLAAGSYRVRADRFPAWDVSPAVASREEARTGGDGARWRGDHQPPPLYLPLVSISRPQAVTLEAPPAFPATFSLPVQLYLRNLKSSRSSQLPRLTPAPLAPPQASRLRHVHPDPIKSHNGQRLGSGHQTDNLPFYDIGRSWRGFG